jgi:hypothetical protein
MTGPARRTWRAGTDSRNRLSKPRLQPIRRVRSRPESRRNDKKLTARNVLQTPHLRAFSCPAHRKDFHFFSDD